MPALTARLQFSLEYSPLKYRVNRRVGDGPRWVRENLGEARCDAEDGYTVWELGARAGRRVKLMTSTDGRARFVPFQWQIDQVVAEERSRAARHEPLAGEEDILDGIEEEYVGQDPTMFDKPLTPSGSGPRRLGSGAFGQPMTPTRRGQSSPASSLSQGQGSSPLSSAQSPQSQGSPSDRCQGQGQGSPSAGRGYGSSPRDQGRDSPSDGKGKQRFGGNGGSAGAGSN